MRPGIGTYDRNENVDRPTRRSQLRPAAQISYKEDLEEFKAQRVAYDNERKSIFELMDWIQNTVSEPLEWICLNLKESWNSRERSNVIKMPSSH